MYTREDWRVMEEELVTMVKFPWSGNTRFGLCPPRKYCFTVAVPSAEIQPTMADDPTIIPVLENPIATKEFVSGADNTKLHTFDEVSTYCLQNLF